METKVEVYRIENLTVKAKIREEKDADDEIIKRLITTVSFDFEGAPGQFDNVLWAQSNDHRVDVTFGSPQSMLGAETISFTAGGKTVTAKADDIKAAIEVMKHGELPPEVQPTLAGWKVTDKKTGEIKTISGHIASIRAKELAGFEDAKAEPLTKEQLEAIKV